MLGENDGSVVSNSDTALGTRRSSNTSTPNRTRCRQRPPPTPLLFTAPVSHRLTRSPYCLIMVSVHFPWAGGAFDTAPLPPVVAITPYRDSRPVERDVTQHPRRERLR